MRKLFFGQLCRCGTYFECWSSGVATTEILGDDYFPVNFFISILGFFVFFSGVGVYSLGFSVYIRSYPM